MGNYDPTNSRTTVDGKEIGEGAGVDDFDEGRGGSFILGPGNRAHGHNKQRRANTVTFNLRVLQDDPESVKYIEGLVDTQRTVAIEERVTDFLEDYDEGEMIALGATRCMILPGTKQLGAEDEAQIISYPVLGINPIKDFKSSE